VGVVVDFQELFRFVICWSAPEIFAIKVESCQKSRKILDDFLSEFHNISNRRRVHSTSWVFNKNRGKYAPSFNVSTVKTTN